MFLVPFGFHPANPSALDVHPEPPEEEEHQGRDAGHQRPAIEHVRGGSQTEDHREHAEGNEGKARPRHPILQRLAGMRAKCTRVVNGVDSIVVRDSSY